MTEGQSLSRLQLSSQPKKIAKDTDLNSSKSTIFALVNTMIGGALLTFPVLFKTTGIISSLVVLLISGLISHRTCLIYIRHMSQRDADIESAIRRISGIRWERIFRTLTGIYLLLLNIIYIDLIVDQTYSAVWFCFHITGHGSAIASPTTNTVVFDSFSAQYMALIYFIPLLSLSFIKNLSCLIRVAEYGVYSGFIYFLFIVYVFISALANGVIDLSVTNWFSWDLGNLPGGCALAFTIHTIANSILKKNREQGNNQRDLLMSYAIGFALYALVSLLGTLAIQSKQCEHTIVDCYKESFEVLFVEISYLLGRIAVFPVVLSISRTRLLQLIAGQVHEKHVTIFNIGFMGIATVFCILSPYLHIELVMNLVGSVVCYFFIYLIPTQLHFTALYRQHKDSLIEEEEQVVEQNSKGHVGGDGLKWKIGRIILYGVINAIGLGIGIFGLYTCIKGIIQ